jgi:quinol monooxygenase YgiN
MYAQRTRLRVPQARMSDLRALIQYEFLPVLSRRPGFIAAYLLEQVDDPNAAEMIQLWDSHSAAEAFTRTGSLAATLESLSLSIPGLRVQREGYIVRVMSGVSAPETAALAR